MSESVVEKAYAMPKKYRQAFLKTVEGAASPREAIKAFCLECMGYARTEVRDCKSIVCPLNHYRPYVSFGDDNEKES